MEAKRVLRTSVLATRASRSAAERELAGAAIAGHGRAAARGHGTVLAYAGVGTEPPTRPLLDALHADGVEVWLPVVTADALEWAPYDGWEALRAGPLDLLEPATPPARSVSAEFAFVPALAVDRSGHRLGRGRGYYDRFLAGAAVTAAAVVYADELLDVVPAGPGDVDVQLAITPGGVTRLGPP